jgi:phosphatidylinositol 4-kinase B
VKDRHNANLLIDKQGHIIHIDFGFMLGSSPGNNMNFESAPFKLTLEYLELLGGDKGRMWALFQQNVVNGFLALNKPVHKKRLMDLMRVSIPDAPGKPAVVEGFLERLERMSHPKIALALISESLNNWRTRMYDNYQRRFNGIL